MVRPPSAGVESMNASRTFKLGCAAYEKEGYSPYVVDERSRSVLSGLKIRTNRQSVVSQFDLGATQQNVDGPPQDSCWPIGRAGRAATGGANIKGDIYEFRP